MGKRRRLEDLRGRRPDSRNQRPWKTDALLRIASCVVYRTPAAMLNKHAFLNQILNGVFRRGLTDGGTKRHKIGLGEFANLLHAGPAGQSPAKATSLKPYRPDPRNPDMQQEEFDYNLSLLHSQPRFADVIYRVKTRGFISDKRNIRGVQSVWECALRLSKRAVA